MRMTIALTKDETALARIATGFIFISFQGANRRGAGLGPGALALLRCGD